MANLDDMHIVNYCHAGCEPLKNIVRLSREKAFALARKLAADHPDTTAFYRFADFVNYYPRRMKADRLLCDAFVSLGGRPKAEHPLSFVLEGSDYLDCWFDHGPVTKIPLKSIPPECISFTYGDSMAVLQREDRFTMLTKETLSEAIDACGGAIDIFLQEIAARYTYIEAQLWNDGCLPARSGARGPEGGRSV